MSAAQAIALAVFAPPLASVLIVLIGERRPNLRESVTVLTALGLFLTVLHLLPEVNAGQRPALGLLEVLPGLSLAFEVEPLGMLFALVASGLWIVTAIYSIGYMRGHHEENQTRFYACFPIALASAMGVAFAANLFTLFVFYEVLTLSTYPLVAHAGTEDAKRGARTYLGLLLGTSIGLQLLAIIWTWQATGTLDFRDGGILAGKMSPGALTVLLALYMFGIGKAALMPFHRWLPAAMVAPTPVSALLHAVAVVKAGVFTVLKVLIYVFGIDLLADTGISDWLMYVAAFTLLTASVVALQQDNLKLRLAYSTVSQLSYIVLGGALATASGMLGGGLHIVMHAFAKITLFFCAGAILVAEHRTQVSQLNGIGRRMPITLTAFFIGTVSLIGLPPAGGTWSKYLLALGAMETGELLMVAALMISSLLNIAYLMPIVVRGFFLPDEHHPDAGFNEAPWTCVAALSFTAIASVGLFFLAEPVLSLLRPIVGGSP